MRTYQTLYQNEIRDLEITINTQSGLEFIPSGAFVTILSTADNDNAYAGTDYTDTPVVSIKPAAIDDNKVSTIIGVDVTANVGTYKVLWKLKNGPYTYYHITDLDIVEP